MHLVRIMGLSSICSVSGSMPLEAQVHILKYNYGILRFICFHTTQFLTDSSFFWAIFFPSLMASRRNFIHL